MSSHVIQALPTRLQNGQLADVSSTRSLSAPSPVKFSLLGTIAIWTFDRAREEYVERPLPEHKARGTLAALLFRANSYMTQSQLSRLLWDDPPESARSNVRSYVAQVRKALHTGLPGDARLSSLKASGVTHSGSYRLRVDPLELDADAFVRLVRQAAEESRAGAVASAAVCLRRALELWQGDAGHDELAVSRALLAQLTALDQLRLGAHEDLLALRLRLGEHRLLVPEIRTLISDHPTREGLWALLMRAYYYSGEIAAALNSYHELRHILDSRLGVRPGAVAAQLHESMLRREDTSV